MMEGAKFLLFGLEFLFVLWVLYANLVTLKNKLEGKIPGWLEKPLGLFLGVPFIILDVIFNIVYGSVLFLKLPDFRNRHWKYMPTFTERCRDVLIREHLRENRSWRYKLAHLICHYMLEPWDPNHCGLLSLQKGMGLR